MKKLINYLKSITIDELVSFLIILFVLWVFATNIIQAFKCTEMTNTELFLHLPKSIILNFENCK